MPALYCSCQCKMCRTPGVSHCQSHPSCVTPAHDSRPVSHDANQVTGVLRELKAASGSHSPSVAQVERALPGLMQIDACFLSNPYATAEVMRRFRTIPDRALETMISHYPTQCGSLAGILAPHLGIPDKNLLLANGASEVIGSLLAQATGPMVLSVPTFSAYYELARGPVIRHRLDPQDDFRVDLDRLEALAVEHSAETVVIINPNNPDGGLVQREALVRFVERLRGRVNQIIVDESFGDFAAESGSQSLAPLVPESPHLVVVNSLSKSYGIAGLRLGYAVMSADRARDLGGSALWNINAFAEWFCTLLSDRAFQAAYAVARRRYVRDSRQFFADLDGLAGIEVFPTAANFALVQLDRPAAEVTGALLARHGIYVRDCADKQGLDGERFIRIAARTAVENRQIIDGLRAVLGCPR